MNENKETPHVFQNRQYDFPYHYLPHFKEDKFQSFRSWNWGVQYMGGIQAVLDQLAGSDLNSLVDVGCGDGRVLNEINKTYSDLDLLGIDISEKAIKFARAFNPNICFEKVSITSVETKRKFDVATAVEVLEHIDPELIRDFLEGIINILNERGRLILTVPHKNQPLLGKHYQHFDKSELHDLLGSFFEHVEIFPIGKRSFLFRLIQLIMGKKGNNFLITNPTLNQMMYGWYLKKHLYSADETNCDRLLAVAQKKDFQ